ncbi:transmembrane 7 superfamily member 3-like [Plakobranchus ocellatus]|uniref:Transmembrane 7 superfamily member 3-like n=1 Tax=Plakobranchus ocellatus TaxID=259542 RepID=A0AAV4A2Z9_9GAST|nr:transmembrane 7 superfamily member 3-like [Plakobranchus ocellatus]
MFKLAVPVVRLPLLVWCLFCFASFGECARYDIPVEKSQTIILPANETSSIATRGLAIQGARFVVIQAHSQRKVLSLSSTKNFEKDYTKSGTNAGLVTLLSVGQDDEVWYIKANSTGNTTVLVIVQLYTSEDPIPGGCNQIFNLELDPSIVLKNDKRYRTTVMFQWANLARPQGVPLPDCEDNLVGSNLVYDVYVYFMQQKDLEEDEFIRSVQRMLRPEDLVEHGTKIYSETDSPTSKSQVSVSSRKGQGVVYGVLVTRKDTGHSATYTSFVSYNCDFDGDTCSIDTSPLQIVGAIFFAIIGLFLLLLGHRYFKATQVVFGFIFCCLLTYILMSLAQTHDWVCLLVAVLLGAIGGGLWFALWHRFNFPTAQVFLMGLCSGYAVAAIIFFTPFGNVSWWSVTVNYALCFVCAALLFSVLLMAFPKLSSITSCSIVGATLVLWSVSIPLWASLEMIFLNAIYHQTEKSYCKVKVAYPINVLDIIIYALWPALTILGMGFQFFRERNSSGFSKPFEPMRAHVLHHPELAQPSGSRGNLYTDDEEDEEERYNVSDTHSNSLMVGASETSRLVPPNNSRNGSQSYRSFQSRQQPPAASYVNAKELNDKLNKII